MPPVSRPHRFPAPDESAPIGRRGRATHSCGQCGASALASCVALCCCPCAVVGCFTLALVKAPYLAGRRCVGLAKKDSLLRKKRVTSLDEEPEQPGAARPSDQVGSGAAVEVGDGRRRSSRSDAEKVWMEMYQVGHWGFGRLSFSGTGAQPRGGSDMDGNAVRQ